MEIEDNSTTMRQESPLPAPEDSTAPRIRPFFRAILFILFTIVAILAYGTAQAKLIHALQLDPAWRNRLLAPASCVIVALLSALFLRKLDRTGFRSLGFWLYPGWLREAALGLVLGGVLLCLTALGIALGGGAVFQGFNPEFSWAGFAGIGIALIFAGAFEEFVFRGYAFQRLVDSIGALGAVLVTSALFGVVHITNPNNPGPLSTANTVLAGVLLAVAYLRTRALWLPIALHWSWNFFQGPILGSNISGTSPGSPLLRFEPAGPDWLSGSTYGFEASVVLTVTCALAIVWMQSTPLARTTPAMLAVLKRTEKT